MRSLVTNSQPDDPGLKVVRRWLMLSVGALITAGLFSLGLIVGRMPPCQGDHRVSRHAEVDP